MKLKKQILNLFKNNTVLTSCLLLIHIRSKAYLAKIHTLRKDYMKTLENYYIYYYVIMSYRILINKIDENNEKKLFEILHSLLDEFDGETIEKYVNNNYIV